MRNKFYLDKTGHLAREFCVWCNYKGKKNNKWYFEYNPNWHGFSGYQRTCTKCGFSVFLYEHNELAIIAEKDNIEKELDKRT